MSQSFQTTPTVTTQIAGSKQQVNLRDYLNTRIAPFLKKALTESLDAEAQYPLQWLGERLIEYSIVFEGNPDSTGVREKYAYKHDDVVSSQNTKASETMMQRDTQSVVPGAGSTHASAVAGHDVVGGGEEQPAAVNGIKSEEMSEVVDGSNTGVPSTGAEVAQETSQDVEMGNST